MEEKGRGCLKQGRGVAGLGDRRRGRIKKKRKREEEEKRVMLVRGEKERRERG